MPVVGCDPPKTVTIVLDRSLNLIDKFPCYWRERRGENLQTRAFVSSCGGCVCNDPSSQVKEEQCYVVIRERLQLDKWLPVIHVLRFANCLVCHGSAAIGRGLASRSSHGCFSTIAFKNLSSTPLSPHTLTPSPSANPSGKLALPSARHWQLHYKAHAILL